jgi:hypothetical protein
MEGLDVHRNPAPGRIIDRRNVVDLTNTPSPVAEQRSNPLSNPNRSKTGSAPSRSDRLHGAALAPPTSTVRSTGSASTLPLTASGAQNRPQGLGNLASSVEEDFGSSILKSLGQSTPRPNHKKTTAYNSYIKPATPGAFRPQGTNSTFNKAFQPQTARPAQHGQTDGWPSWLINGQSNLGVKFPSGPSRLPARPVADDNPAEMFNLDDAPVTAEDDVRHQGDADDHMRELLSGAIGDAEGDMGDDAVKEGEDVVDGFAKGVRLMPHQVRGVRWMRSRESGRKYGGILADVSGWSNVDIGHSPLTFTDQDMGLGKTVQTLARIVEGAPTAQERKAGFKGGTLWVSAVSLPKTTLRSSRIVAPLAVMEQWAAEVRNKTSPGRIKVSTHHGPSRSKCMCLFHFLECEPTYPQRAKHWNRSMSLLPLFKPSHLNLVHTRHPQTRNPPIRMLPTASASAARL